MQELKTALKAAAKDLFGIDIEPELSRPDENFGDYSTNAALQLAGRLQRSPHEIAQKLAESLTQNNLLSRVQVAGPGFINFSLSDAVLARMAWTASQLPRSDEGKEFVVEFGDPNPFKEMHIGHLYSYIVGDSIARLLEARGAVVRRVSYHGDVGLHVAKAIWGMRNSEVNIDADDSDGRYIGVFYAKGAQAYENDPAAAEEIARINERIYKKDDPEINRLYEWGRRTSFAYFDQILKRISIVNDKRYLESQSAAAGLEFVRQHTGSVFTESDGAVIYEGEKVGLHTRVFITSKGLPTYEAKDLGLAELKKQDFPGASRSIIITANEQSEYFKVMLAALSEFDKELADKTTHLAHGFVSLSTGKMSSRTGEVYGAVELLDDVETAAQRAYPDTDRETFLGAVKYAFLKHRLGSDLTYDISESVSLEGNSGPYLQYAHARACSILSKIDGPGELGQFEFDESERSLARKVSEYPEVVAKASDELMPHHITVYLYELAQVFNRFYENSRIMGDERQAIRAKLTDSYRQVLKHGLSLLSIEAPEKV